MIISRCVPVEIARKKFSEFTKPHSPEQVVFVGWKYKDQTKTKKQNVQVHYKHIKQDIIDWIEEHGGLPSDDPIVPSLADVNEVYFHNVTGEALDDNGNKIIDLHHDLGAIEINGGGDYTTDMFYLKNAVVGSITNVVVDNTGRNSTDKVTDTFVLYYGINGQGMNQEILRVPALHRGIAQILHTTDSDIVINANYTEMANYIEDVQQYINTNEDDTGQIQIFTPGNNWDQYIELVDNGDDTKSYEVDLNQEKGYVEFIPPADSDSDRYRFYFKNPELGSSTFLVINNGNNANAVTIVYAKKMDGTSVGEITAMEEEVAEVASGEKCVIEIFHSLSTDIVAKVTKV